MGQPSPHSGRTGGYASRHGDPPRHPRRGRRPLRGSAGPVAPTRRRLERDVELPRARPAEPGRRLAAPRDRARRRRSDARPGRPRRPALPAVYFGAMRAGVVVVPLDLRMSPDAIERIAEKADARRLAIGTGRDAPDPREAGLEHFPTSTVEDLAAEPDPAWPADWAEQVAAWPRPGPGRPVRDHLHERHDRDPEGRDAQPRERRGHDRDRPQRDPAPGAPARVAPAAVAPHGAGDRAVLRADGRAPTSSTSGAATRGSSSRRSATTG